MKKDKIIKFLDDNNITYNEQATYKELLKVYYDNQKPIAEEVTEVTSSEVVEETIEDIISEIVAEITSDNESPTENSPLAENQLVTVDVEVPAIVAISSEVIPEPISIRDKLILDIVEFMNSIKGKTKGTPQEIRRMFELYNNFYKRSESPGCSVCIGNVHAKMMAIYKKYKVN